MKHSFELNCRLAVRSLASFAALMQVLAGRMQVYIFRAVSLHVCLAQKRRAGRA